MEKSLYLDHVALFRAFSTSPASTPKSHLRSLTPKERQGRIWEEQRRAKRQREAQEAARPKYVLEELVASPSKSPAYYISRAREKHLQTISARPKSVAFRAFSPLKSPFARTARLPDSPTSPSKSSHCASYRKEMTEALPDWVLQRSDFLSSYTRIREGTGIDLLEVCKLPRVQRKEAELNALVQWTLTIPFFAGLPRTVLKDLCGKFQAVTAAKDSVGKEIGSGETGRNWRLVIRSLQRAN